MIDIARDIKKNTPFIGNIAYSQREFSYDNSLMDLVRHTIEFIKQKPYGNKLLAKVKDEVKLIMMQHLDTSRMIGRRLSNRTRRMSFGMLISKNILPYSDSAS